MLRTANLGVHSGSQSPSLLCDSGGVSPSGHFHLSVTPRMQPKVSLTVSRSKIFLTTMATCTSRALPTFSRSWCVASVARLARFSLESCEAAAAPPLGSS